MKEPIENVYYLYEHKNKINGKSYIGQTRQKPTTRWGFGCGYKHNKRFYDDIQKYGWDNFEHKILAERMCKKQVDYAEKRFIKFLRLTDERYGYNIAPGGNERILTKEAREKIRKSKLGHIVSEETRKKISISKKGTTHTTSEETKEKIRKKMLGRIISEDTRNKISQAKKGHTPWNKGKTGVYSQETLKKMGEKNIGKTAWNKGLSTPKETRIKISKSLKKKGDIQAC